MPRATDEDARAYTYAAEQIWETVRGLDTALQVHHPRKHALLIPPWRELNGFQQAVFCRRVRLTLTQAADAIEAALT